MTLIDLKKIIFLLLIISLPEIYPQLLSFPAAEGYGKYSAGGRGGKLFKVSNLNDNGPGSLREAVESNGARIIIFTISGNIDLKSPLEIINDSVTIAGQTAPGHGICIRNFPFTVSANHVIIRYIRFRLGDKFRIPEDAINGIEKKHDIIIDHCSASWGIDEVMTFWNAENITVQWCIISESLNSSYHSKGNHGYGGIWGGKNASYHHNLIAHHTSRTPRFSGGTTSKSENLDFINNVIYNWGYNSVYGGEGGSFNIVGNYYKPGPATLKKVNNRIAEPWSSGKWYISGNYMDGDTAVTYDNWDGGVDPKDMQVSEIRSYMPVEEISVVVESPETAYDRILRYGGASLPIRDNTDKRITDEVISGSAAYKGEGYTKEFNLAGDLITGIIDSQDDVGGWPELDSDSIPADSDNDGIPDDWEIKNGLDPYNPEDSKKFNENGYTFLEEYINSLGSSGSEGN
jgi:pectate lyase